MNWTQTSAVVLPCFNEGPTLAPLVHEIRQIVPRVIVVDDGSMDDTAAEAARAGAQVIRHPKNLGKGAAIRSGLAAATELGMDWAFTMDGDGQHAPSDIPAFWRCAEQPHVALVVGNRMSQRPPMPWLRLQVNRWMSRRISGRAGREMPDTQCGFRLVNLSAWSQISLATRHFEMESEMMLAFVAAGLGIEFIPIHTPDTVRPSKIHPVADTYRWLRWWLTTDLCKKIKP